MPCSRAERDRPRHRGVGVEVAGPGAAVPALQRTVCGDPHRAGVDVDDPAPDHPHEAWKPVQAVRRHAVARGLGKEPGRQIRAVRGHAGRLQRAAHRVVKLIERYSHGCSVTQVTLLGAAYADRPTPRTGRSPAADSACFRPLGRQDPLDRRQLEAEDGSPVFTVEGRYRARGWTEWTQGFQFGSALLQFDATGDEQFLDLGRAAHARADGAAPHPHGRARSRLQQRQHLRQPVAAGARRTDRGERVGIALLRAGAQGQRRRAGASLDAGSPRAASSIPSTARTRCSSTPSARCARWRSAHVLGQRLMEEQDAAISLLDRLLDHARTTAHYNVYFGRGRDGYDVRGRTAHESLFNVASGTYRGPSTQQGYSPFSTWTRGLAWAMLGFAEQLEFLATLAGRSAATPSMLLDAAHRHLRPLHRRSDRGRRHSRTGTPARPGWRCCPTGAITPSDPFNEHEPVDSSAAAIAAQGLLRLARLLASARTPARGRSLHAGRPARASTRCSRKPARTSAPIRITRD